MTPAEQHKRERRRLAWRLLGEACLKAAESESSQDADYLVAKTLDTLCNDLSQETGGDHQNSKFNREYSPAALWTAISHIAGLLMIRARGRLEQP